MTAILLLLAGRALAAGATTEIKVDQVGYLTGAPKVALVASKSAASEFTVRRASDGGVALRGALAAAVDDPDSGDRVQAADFSKLTAPGKYYLEIAGVGRSWEFAIGPDVYGRAWYLAMRSYYGQRCGTAVDLGREFPGFQTRGVPPGRRVARIQRQERSASVQRGVARRGRLRPLRGELRTHHGDALVDLGDVRAPGARRETESAGDRQRHAGHSQ